MSYIPVNSAAETFRTIAIGEPRPGASSLEEEVLGIFLTLRVSLLRYAVSLGLSVHDSEDLIQEVFLALFRHLRMDRSRSNLRGWLFRVTYNLALKRRASLGSEKKLIDNNQEFADVFCDPSPNPEAQLLLDERQRRLMAIFTALPRKDQWCLRLRAEGLRYREISQVAQMSLGSVSVSLARSLARLASIDR